MQLQIIYKLCGYVTLNGIRCSGHDEVDSFDTTEGCYKYSKDVCVTLQRHNQLADADARYTMSQHLGVV